MSRGWVSTRSPNNAAVTLREAVTRGLAPDGGLYMPVSIARMSPQFFAELPGAKLGAIAESIALHLFAGELPEPDLRGLVQKSCTFDAPLVGLPDGSFMLELFHGPTLAFKDFGARFMAALLGYFAQQDGVTTTVLVATSGDTGGAVAAGFHGVAGVRVVILFPKGRVSALQRLQLTTWGGNITALEVNGTFDDCQRLVKEAFADSQLTQTLRLTSANSINIARLIPQSFYYFRAAAQYLELSGDHVESTNFIFSVPSGNFGNLTAAVIARELGLRIAKVVAATNANDVIPEYLRSGRFCPRSSKATISNAMDVGNPSNFERLQHLFSGNHEQLKALVWGTAVSDDVTKQGIRECFMRDDYLLDPHAAVARIGLWRYLAVGTETAVPIALATAHPAKFIDTIRDVLHFDPPLPGSLAALQSKESRATEIGAEIDALKQQLLPP